jgi:hypothetical protein
MSKSEAVNGLPEIASLFQMRKNGFGRSFF